MERWEWQCCSGQCRGVMMRNDVSQERTARCACKWEARFHAGSFESVAQKRIAQNMPAMLDEMHEALMHCTVSICSCHLSRRRSCIVVRILGMNSAECPF